MEGGRSDGVSGRRGASEGGEVGSLAEVAGIHEAPWIVMRCDGGGGGGRRWRSRGW